MAVTKAKVAAEASKAEAPKKEDAKKVEVKETAPKKEVVKKEVAKKEPKAKKTTSKETAAKKATTKEAAAKKVSPKKTAKAVVDVKLQFDEKEYTQEDLIKIANDVWVYDYDKKPSELTKIQLYVKPSDSKVYYVFNDDITGDFDI